jgi:ABC-2 type transport system permease protein
MRLPVFRVMLLALLRDPGALVLAFILPPLVYVVFASIFSGTSGDELRLRVAIYDAADTETTRRLIKEIRADASFRKPERDPKSESELSDFVRQDIADAGLLIRADPGTAKTGVTESPLLIVGDAAKAMAGPIASGQIQRIINERMPDTAYRRLFVDIEETFIKLTPQQKGRVDAILSTIKDEAMDQDKGDKQESKDETVKRAAPIAERKDLEKPMKASAAVVYYAGAVAIMFLMFASLQGAMQIIDERRSGVMDRLLAGPARRSQLLAGKFAFLIIQGFLQVSLIFAAAALLYDVTLGARWPMWVAITFAAAAAAAGLGLLLSAACSTREQAQTLSTFLILIASAIGGSMVPRYLMPPWLQEFGWVAPNAWVVEAYHGLLWRNAPDAALWPLIGLMLVLAVITFAMAAFMLNGHRPR